MSHSPGPWSVSRVNDGRFEINSDSSPWKAIGIVTANHEGSGKVSTSEAEANADLFAAAPDLLAACKAFVSDLNEKVVALGWESADQYKAACGADDPYILAKAAIAKAEGGAA